MKQKLLLLFALLLSVCSGAWAEDTYVELRTVDFTEMTAQSFSSNGANYVADAGYTDIIFYKKKDYTLSLNTVIGTDGKITGEGVAFGGQNIAKNHLVAIPLTGVNEKLRVTFYHRYNSNKASFKYYYLDNKTTYTESDYPSSGISTVQDAKYADTETSITITSGLTHDKGILLVGEAGSGYQEIKKVVIETLAPAGPSITTQPQSASYVSGDPIAALSVVATASTGELSYQWHSCDDALKTNPQDVGTNSASYTPSGAGFYYVTVTDDNGSVDSNVAQITVSAAAAPTISIDASETDVTAGTSITLTATADGVPGPTLKWYVSDTNDTSAGVEIDGETADTYVFDAVVGTKYYYAKAFNSVEPSGVASNVITITAAARTGSDLNQVVYSNGFDAFITDPDGENHGTIKAYYLEGTAAPTVASINASAGATYEVVGNTFTLTSEDEATSKVYDVTLTAVAPYSEDGVTFNGTEDWVVSAYGFCAESGKQGYRFQKTGTEGSADYWSRAKSGKTRMYFFLDANTSVTLANGGSTRDVKVYKNGTVVSGVTKSNALTNIPGEAEPYMLAIVSNQNGGDGALNVITITGPQTTATAETITPAKELTTYVPQHKLDFTSTDKLTAFIATATSATSVTLTNVDIVPAGTPIVVKATETASPIAVTISDGEADDVSSNKLLRGDGSTSIGTAAEKIGTGEGEKYDYILSDGKFYRATVGTVAPGKAYLHLTEAPSDAKALTISFGGDGETTGIEAIHNSQFTIHTDAPMYNLSGQRVGENYKGIVIVNGKKYMNK